MMVTVVRRMVMAGIEVLALLLSVVPVVLGVLVVIVGSIVLQLSVSHLEMEGLRGSK